MILNNANLEQAIIILAPLYLASVMLIFILSRKWVYDRILMADLVATVFCLLSFSMGGTAMAIVIISVSKSVFVVYSMFFRRRNV